MVFIDAFSPVKAVSPSGVSTARTAAARSAQWSTIPPSTFPSVFASFGRTSWTISTRVSRGVLPTRLAERGVDVLQNFDGIGVRALLGELDRFLDLLFDPLERRLLVPLVDDAALHQELLVPRNRVALLPVLELLRRPVRRGVDLRVAVPTVCLHLDQGRALAAPRAADRLLRCLVRQNEVVPVDRDAGETVRLGALGDVLERNTHALRHRFGPEVVLHHEDAVQLMDSREVQGL